MIRGLRYFGCLAATLLSALTLPLPGRATTSAPPPVDLRALALSPEGATVPTSTGDPAELTLDPALQRTADRLLARARPVAGAVVLIEARTGRALVLSETRLERGSGSVLTTGAPAASLFKIVTTAALIERRVYPDRRVCWSGGHRRIELRHLETARDEDAVCAPFGQALGFSRNAVYAQLATRFLPPEGLMSMARSFGFNGDVPFDLPVPVGAAELPDEPLEFARAAAGFRGTTLTPLGAAHLAYAVATGGRAARMILVQRAGDYVAPERRQLLGRVMRESTAYELRKMMEVTVHAGTSLRAFTNEDGRSYLGSLRVAGKTGTLKPAASQPTTTWFTGFAPSRRPRVIVAVLLQNGPVWRRKANELARDVLRAYFAGRGYRGITHPLGDDRTALR